jgi:hypothetical protein
VFLQSRAIPRGTRPLPALGGYANRKIAYAVDEAGAQVDGVADHFDAGQAFEDFFPQDVELHLPEAIAEAAVYTEAE